MIAIQAVRNALLVYSSAYAAIELHLCAAVFLAAVDCTVSIAASERSCRIAVRRSEGSYLSPAMAGTLRPFNFPCVGNVYGCG
jgi:hypothetical protein